MKKIITCLAVFLCLQSKAQHSTFIRYSTEHGLANSVVYRICKDQKGYLWATTDYGVSCFDGKIFKNFFPEKFGNLSVMAMCCDKEDRIWVASLSAQFKNIFYIKDGIVTEFKCRSGALPPFMTQLTSDLSGRTWILNKDSLAGYILKDDYIPFKINADQHYTVKINKIFPQRDSSILFATDKGIYILSKNQTLSIFSEKFKLKKFYSIAEDKAGNLFFGGEGFILKYDRRQKSYDSISTQTSKPVQNICIEASEKIWYSTTEPGFHVIPGNKDRDLASYTELKNVFIDDILYDKGVVFLASYGRGLFVLNHLNVTYYGNLPGLNNPSISCLRKKGKDLYIAGFGGICIFKNGVFSELKKIDIPETERVNDILFDKDETWFITPYRTYRYNNVSMKYVTYECGGICLFKASDSIIWAGGYSNIYYFRKKNKHPEFSILESPIKNFRTFRILNNSSGEYWFATSNGAFRFKNGKWLQYNEENSPVKRGVVDITFDSLGNTWMTTPASLLRLDAKGSWKIFTTKDGLSSTLAQDIEANEGLIWFGGVRGLNSYNGKDFKHYSTGYGLPLDEITSMQSDTLQRTWIGTNRGLYSWDRKEDGTNYLLEMPSLDYEINGIKQKTPGDSPLLLPYKNNNVTLHFVSPNFKMPENILYEFQLGPIQSTFEEIPDNNIHFSSLSPGTYTFFVRARLKDNTAISTVKKVVLVVLKPTWQEWWFITALLLLLILSGIIFIKKRIDKVKLVEKQKAKRYARLLQLKQQATNALINPHFIFNALNSIQLFINQSDALSANKFLTRFASLIRSTMENATHLNIPLVDELKNIELYLSLEAIRLKEKLHYVITIDPSIDANKILFPSMLLQPYIENAIWHGIMPTGEKGIIRIDILKLTDPYIRITITDNGIGYSVNDQNENSTHKSFGLDINKKRLLHIEKLTGYKTTFYITPLIDNEIIIGTSVVLEIPCME